MRPHPVASQVKPILSDLENATVTPTVVELGGASAVVKSGQQKAETDAAIPAYNQAAGADKSKIDAHNSLEKALAERNKQDLLFLSMQPPVPKPAPISDAAGSSSDHGAPAASSSTIGPKASPTTAKANGGKKAPKTGKKAAASAAPPKDLFNQLTTPVLQEGPPELDKTGFSTNPKIAEIALGDEFANIRAAVGDTLRSTDLNPDSAHTWNHSLGQSAQSLELATTLQENAGVSSDVSELVGAESKYKTLTLELLEKTLMKLNRTMPKIVNGSSMGDYAIDRDGGRELAAELNSVMPTGFAGLRKDMPVSEKNTMLAQVLEILGLCSF